MAESCCDRLGLDRSPGPGRDRAERDRAEGDAVDAGRLVSDRLKETANLPIPTFVQIDQEMRLPS
jgi:hypothetical protein